jgi:hypothetical protein
VYTFGTKERVFEADPGQTIIRAQSNIGTIIQIGISPMELPVHPERSRFSGGAWDLAWSATALES